MENLSPEESLSEFLRILQLNVSQVFKKHKDFDDEITIQPERRFKNGNKIPKIIRNLMRNKANLSKSILRAKSVHKYLVLKDKLETIEIKLKNSYQKRRSEQEKTAIDNMKKDPKSFFTYAKRFSKSNADIGPFFNKDGNPVRYPERIVAMQELQYGSAFSNPRKKCWWKMWKNPFPAMNQKQNWTICT